jgi:hypothetical protein
MRSSGRFYPDTPSPLPAPKSRPAPEMRFSAKYIEYRNILTGSSGPAKLNYRSFALSDEHS